MYRYYRKDSYDVMEYEFDSITEFINYLDDTPTNIEAWSDYCLESCSKNYEFCRTHSLQEAKDLCKYGYHEEFNRLVELKFTLEKYIKESHMRRRQHNYYVGYAPDVKSYLEGNPLSMLNKQNPKRNHIDIYYNVAVLCSVTKSQVFHRGAITLSVVEALESMGFSVGLHVFSMSYDYSQIHYAKFHLKRDNERMNIQKLFFPLCHPSFLRRLIFRLREVTPDINSNWAQDYGCTVDDYTIRRIIDLKDNDIVICQPSEMGVGGYDILEDANHMFNYINNFTSDSIQFSHIEREERQKQKQLIS